MLNPNIARHRGLNSNAIPFYIMFCKEKISVVQ